MLKVAEAPNMLSVIRDRKYRSGTLFLVLSAVIAQCSGINAINIYSSEILLLIPQVPTELGVYMLALANVIGALLSLSLNKCFSIRTLLIGGQFVMAFFLAAIVLF